MRAWFRSISMCLAALGLWSVSGHGEAQESGCGNPFYNGSNGPDDFRLITPARRATVERHHFTEDVRTLRSGKTTKEPGADISYTLRVFPNHPEALAAMGQLALRTGQNPPPGSVYTVECWFDRGIRFRPDDGAVRMAYGIYQFKARRLAAAAEQFEAALRVGGNDGNAHYNLGLVRFDMKQYEKALEHAHAAYRTGFTLPGLKNRLKQAGKWRDLPARPEDAN